MSSFFTEHRLSGRDHEYAQSCLNWLRRNGSRPYTPSEMRRGMRQEIKEDFKINPIIMFFLSFAINKIINMVIDWFYKNQVRGSSSNKVIIDEET